MSGPGDPRLRIQQHLRGASNYNRWIVDLAVPHLGRRVLDAGCGAANLSALLVHRVDAVVGVDNWSGYAAEHDPEGPFTRIVADLADDGLPETLRPHRLDSALCSNVLEHIEDDVGALRGIARSLPSGSPVVVLVPAFMLLYGAHDRADHHVRRYRRDSLAAVAERAGLVVERIHYLNLPGFFAWLLVVRLLARQLDETSVGLYDRLIPLVRRIEDRRRPPFGQSLVAYLRT